jgi:multiple sugar transport system permease protein
MIDEVKENVIAETAESVPLKKIAPPKKGINPLKKQENLVGWLFCSPIIVGMLVFTALPLILSIISMFYHWTGNSFVTDSKFAGFDNFKTIFAGGYYSEMFGKSLGNTVLFMIQLPIGLILGVFLALAMNRKMLGVQTYRILYYLPSVMSIVAVTIVFQHMFEPGGYINSLFHSNTDWLDSRGGLTFTVNFMMVWKGVGYTSLMYIAGLQSVSTDQLEAARIDGANGWTIFRKITLPALYPITFYLLVTGVMGAVQVFNEPFILAGGYGTDNTAMTAVSFIYYQFGQKRLGVAAVASWVLAFIIFVITMIQMYFDNRKDKEA